MAPIVAEGSHATHRHAVKAGRGGVLTEERSRELAPEIAHMAGELRKPKAHEPVKLAHAVTEVLAQAIRFAEILEGSGRTGQSQLADRPG